MDSALSLSTASFTLFTISKALNRHLSHNAPTRLLVTRRLSSLHSRRNTSFSPPASSLKALSVVLPLFRRRLECVSNSAASFSASSGGGTGARGPFGGDGGGGGGDGSDSGDVKSNLAAGATEGVSELSPEVIILDVGGMTCGGCAASVKRILENQAQVSSASVNLTTETAIVWPVSEAKVVPNWQKQLGEELAKQLTSCGFKSNLRGRGATDGDMSL